MIAGVGIIASIIGTFLVKIKDNSAREAKVQSALNLGNWTSIGITAIAVYFLIDWMLPDNLYMEFFGEGLYLIGKMNVFSATLVGLAVGGLISMITEYYTGLGKKPVMNIIRNSSTGAATNIIAGLSVGMISTFASVLLFAGAIWASYELAGFYGVAISASAMMATTAMALAIDAFGPIADNAGGVAEMSELPKEVRERTDILDSVGNTTAAIGKGFAIASAALTALALFAAYVTFTGIDGINIFKAKTLAALFVGGMVPVVFSALAMQSVGKAAMEMVKEVRRQFKEIPGILEGTGKPEYGKCVEISTKAALREMMLPGALTIMTPILVGFLMGAEALGAYMAGVTVSGVLWAIFQNNAGGAWDNAKKSFEAGVEIDGKMTYKGSEAHKAAVTGDTVGDPFKDTSGPSMNILIKLTCLVGLILAPILGSENKDSLFADTIENTQSVSSELDSEGNFIYNLGNETEISLKSGAQLKVGDRSAEMRLFRILNSLENPSQDLYRSRGAIWVTLDRVRFSSGSASLMSDSEAQIKDISMLLKDYPNAKVKIGGYTDNTGSEETNLKISTDRANMVKRALMKFGVDESRMQAEGYGADHFVCKTNDTDVCKAQNRRVDIKVTE